MSGQEGLVVALEANRPTIQASDGTTYLGLLRGKLRQTVGQVLVGDRVRFAPTDPGEAVVLEVAPRRNQLVRPPVANVEGMFALFSLVSPRGNRELLDKRLAIAHLMDLAAEVVITKVDLLEDPSPALALKAVYERAGYRVWLVSAVTLSGVQAWLEGSRQGIWVLTGESGVGKSSLIRAALPEATVESQGLSRIGRGRQTTRTVRLWPFGPEAWLADTPGFTQLSYQVADRRQILAAFPEIAAVRCRYSDCWHLREPGCEVQAAVAAGQIDPVRYRHYCQLLDEWYQPRR